MRRETVTTLPLFRHFPFYTSLQGKGTERHIGEELQN